MSAVGDHRNAQFDSARSSLSEHPVESPKERLQQEALELSSKQFASGVEKLSSPPEFLPPTDLVISDLPGKTKETTADIDNPVDFANAQKELQKNGRDPLPLMKDLMEKERVIGIGETHELENAQRSFGPQMIAALKEAGATHLAIEAPSSAQPVLDEFMKTGKFDLANWHSGLKGQIFDIFEAARTAGIKIVAVDWDGGSTDPQREKTLAGNIQSILQDDPKNKVILWIGGLHLQDPSGTDFCTPSDGCFADTVQLLRQHTPVSTFFYVANNGSDELGKLGADLAGPSAVSTADSPTLAAMSTRAGREMKNWNFVIFYPEKI